MLYEMLTRKKPFFGENLTAVTHKIVYEPPPPPQAIVPGLPESLLRVIDRALAKDPDQRYGRAGEMAADLKAEYSPTARSPATTTGSFLAADASGAQSAGTPPAAPQASVQPALTEDGTLNVTGGAVVSSRAEATFATGSPAAGVPAAGVSAAPSGTAVPASGAHPASVTPPPMAAPAPRKSSPLPWVVVAVLVVGVTAAGVFTLVGRDSDPAPPAERLDPEQELRARYIEEGRQLLAAGNPRQAVSAFDRALAIVPDDREIQELRQQAEATALGLESGDDQVEQGLTEACRALAASEYPSAIQAAQTVLELDPQNRTAQDLLAEAEEGQRRKDQVRDRLASGGRAETATPTQVTGTPPPSTAAPAARATLDIEFHSGLPEGRVTVYAGQERIFQESFKFGGRKSGVFRRSREPVFGAPHLQPRAVLGQGDAADLRHDQGRPDQDRRGRRRAAAGGHGDAADLPVAGRPVAGRGRVGTGPAWPPAGDRRLSGPAPCPALTPWAGTLSGPYTLGRHLPRKGEIL